ncbi:Alpha ketoglutarate dependent [Paragonimus heterotremus]|uniref:Alpha ketoglutarate dependent n=1 Tax=Paragonimus heterotremus TaxID=100268 RepID=A0A8J4WMJ2_9TREM|nr:Alpha ketoglutarate dependent [Paragonimus heterotremus]
MCLILFQTSSVNRIQLCGCKGVRSCTLCGDAKSTAYEIPLPVFTLNFCKVCDHVFSGTTHACCRPECVKDVKFDGVFILTDFVNEEEESFLLNAIDQNPWVLSQSGRRKQDYGPKVNFKRRRVTYGRFTGLPAYCRFLVDRINQTLGNHPRLQHPAFYPVELCNLEYNPDRGACIVPHLDDVWLWGDRLITLNLCSSTVLTFSLPDNESPQVADEFKKVRSILDPEHDVQVCWGFSAVRKSLILLVASSISQFLLLLFPPDIIESHETV